MDHGSDDGHEQLEERAQKLRVRLVDLAKLEIDPGLRTILSKVVCRRYQAVCIGKVERRLIVAMADPSDVFAIDDIRFRTGFAVEAVLARPSDIMAAVERLEEPLEDTRNSVRTSRVPVVDEEQLRRIRRAFAKEDAEATNSPMLQLVNMLIAKGLVQQASEVHIDPSEEAVTYWKDGAVVEHLDVPGVIFPTVVNCLKVMGQLRIDKKKEPQEGRVLWGGDFVLLVSTRASAKGESLTIRIAE